MLWPTDNLERLWQHCLSCLRSAATVFEWKRNTKWREADVLSGSSAPRVTQTNAPPLRTVWSVLHFLPGQSSEKCSVVFPKIFKLHWFEWEFWTGHNFFLNFLKTSNLIPSDIIRPFCTRQSGIIFLRPSVPEMHVFDLWIWPLISNSVGPWQSGSSKIGG